MSNNDLSTIFWSQGLCFIKHNSFNSSLSGNRKFRAFFGVSSTICAILWNLIEQEHANSETKHLLWCLFFLKNYNIEHVNASIFEVDEKTYRLWVWRFIRMLASLKVVCFYLKLCYKI